ncbi:MAG: MCP four helix bundle domain-containing protein, partial [Bacteroidetes bacterium]|nr:MCP four helix bundle domain-containing protein [Bacteroidota bacterium]
MALRDLKIGTKQGIGFGVILVVMAGVSFFVINQMGALRDEIDDINQLWLGRAVVSARLNVNASALRTVQLEHALATNRRRRQLYADSMNTLIDEIYAGGDAYDTLMAEVKNSPLFSEEEEVLTDELEEVWDTYLLLTMAFVDLRRQEALDFFNGEMRTVFDDFSTKLQRLVKLNEASAAEAASELPPARARILYLDLNLALDGYARDVGYDGPLTEPVREWLKHH